MKPQVVQRGPLYLAGLSFFGDPFGESAGWTEENEIGRLWNRLLILLQEHPQVLQAANNPQVSYEVHIEHPETRTRGHREVFTGVEVAEPGSMPVQFTLKVLPPTQYAVFTLCGQEITGDWPFLMYGEWLPAAGLQPAHPFMIEVYDQRFHGMDRVADSEIEVHIPVQPLATPSRPSQ